MEENIKVEVEKTSKHHIEVEVWVVQWILKVIESCIKQNGVKHFGMHQNGKSVI